MIYLFLLPVILLSIALHELSHGFVAYLFGDTTAKEAGRLTLNPLAHIDLVGTLIVPFLLIVTVGVPFGWAKPVPINPYMLKNPKVNMIWIAAAGPLANIFLAFVAIQLLGVSAIKAIDVVKVLLAYMVVLNVALACFNILPVPPLDGSKVLAGLLPRRQAIAFARLESYGLLIVGVLIYMGFVGKWLRVSTQYVLHFLGVEDITVLL